MSTYGFVFNSLKTALDFYQSDSCGKCGIPFSAISKQVTGKLFKIGIDLGCRCSESSCGSYYCPGCGSHGTQCQLLVQKLLVNGEMIVDRCEGTIKRIYIE